MYLTTAPPLLFALGIRLFLNAINPDHKDSTADHLLQGLWQGVLLYHVLKHTTWAVFPVGFAIAAKLLYDFASNFDTTRCACVLLGAALGVLCTDLITQLFEEGRYNEVQPRSPATTVALQASSRETSSRRQRVVSFEHGIDRDRPSRRHKSSADRARANASSPAPTNAHSISTALTLDSLPSSIDPLGRMPPAEREIAVLRARASLADSERRRFKEERKWALSQGNIARADQLDWQVKRYSTLMDSYHREADAKVVEARTSVAAQANQRPIPVPPPAQVTRHSQITYSQPSPQPVPAQISTSNGTPLVSVTLGGAGPSRSRKKSGGGSILKPSVHVHTRWSVWYEMCSNTTLMSSNMQI
ncbi:uncharacterized protein PHACADRAFT_29707 [Phanerochaete carnosa HHB-10118-sp]|uniref:Uncharacterized protein n=1 Tax=Phanerochaete carnosa (strain HHB-10118-sp) TaxID=650164 RepID=K5UWR3_PHACS|nr:uncharacterized protein PHACADRAFT_29707 [Phanerochaete carnosa HHB-10118-sp]EKM54496.1 hypothetical protein PHACADRAFT_29707 [Phanerochaete carnosa HHB-10118-sp]